MTRGGRHKGEGAEGGGVGSGVSRGRGDVGDRDSRGGVAVVPPDGGLLRQAGGAVTKVATPAGYGGSPSGSQAVAATRGAEAAATAAPPTARAARLTSGAAVEATGAAADPCRHRGASSRRLQCRGAGRAPRAILRSWWGPVRASIRADNRNARRREAPEQTAGDSEAGRDRNTEGAPAEATAPRRPPATRQQQSRWGLMEPRSAPRRGAETGRG